ncbi:hypothetical protein GQ457_05G010890 [Hibiscus cannabinus]
MPRCCRRLGEVRNRSEFKEPTWTARLTQFVVKTSWSQVHTSGILGRCSNFFLLRMHKQYSVGEMNIWGHHPTGAYITRTGYNWLLYNEDIHQLETLLWKVMAKLPVQPKIRIFGWRLGHNALPVGQLISAAQVGSGSCRMCDKETETMLHAMRECLQVQSVFHISGMDLLLPQGPFISCLEWLMECWSLLERAQFTFLILLLWNIWNRRNRWVHNNQLIPTRLVSEYAQVVAVDAQGANEDIVHRVPCDRSKRWKKPEAGQVKINVDGAWLAASRQASIGVIARDHHGLMLEGFARKLDGAHSAETAEACAFEAGFLMAVSKGWERVIIEGDALAMVNRLCTERPDYSVTGSFLTETKVRLKGHPDFAVQHVAREANTVAHVLAHHSLDSSTDYYFDDVLPDFISNHVINDAIYG